MVVFKKIVFAARREFLMQIAPILPTKYRAKISGPDLTAAEVELGIALFSLDGNITNALKTFEACLSDSPELTADSFWFFQPSFYMERAKAVGLPSLKDASPLHHWLKLGVKKRIVPTLLFDEEFYLETYGDVKKAGVWGFQHFIEHGFKEKRKRAYQPNVPAVDIPERLLREGSVASVKDGHKLAQKNAEALLRNFEFREMLSGLQKIEPKIGDLKSYKMVYTAPFHDFLSSLHLEMRSRLNRDHFDTVVCVPWIRMGGADLVAAFISQSLLRIRADESILLLQTDQPHFEWPDIIPSYLERVDISDIVQFAGQEFAERLLHSMLRGIKPKRVINVNSRLCWSTFRRFGRQLMKETQLYSYLFCWDRTLSGLRAGYPSEFYAETAPFLKAVFTDTDFLRDELVRLYHLSPELQERLVTLRSPPRLSFCSPTKAECAAHTTGLRSRPLILWAGRLDRQKRFDLVLEIAKAMPEIDFHCWGKPLLDAPPDFSDMPSNVTLFEPFRSYDELPLDRCDGWLYTSEWDGMPTLLIELANQGIPIVASAVEGICELILQDTGWPVYDWQSPSAYVSALDEMIASVPERILRAKRLQDLASLNYSISKYDGDLEIVLSREVNGD